VSCTSVTPGISLRTLLDPLDADDYYNIEEARYASETTEKVYISKIILKVKDCNGAKMRCKNLFSNFVCNFKCNTFSVVSNRPVASPPSRPLVSF
jgi:hypothetical protein